MSRVVVAYLCLFVLSGALGYAVNREVRTAQRLQTELLPLIRQTKEELTTLRTVMARSEQEWERRLQTVSRLVMFSWKPSMQEHWRLSEQLDAVVERLEALEVENARP